MKLLLGGREAYALHCADGSAGGCSRDSGRLPEHKGAAAGQHEELDGLRGLQMPAGRLKML